MSVLPEYAEKIHEWTQRMADRGVHAPWRGEGLGPLGVRTVEEMLRPKREQPDGRIRHAILLRQKYCCADCGDYLLSLEFDHRAPLRALTVHQPQG